MRGTSNAAPVPLAADRDRLPPYRIDLDDARRRRVEALLTGGPVISLHDHPVRLPDPLDSESLRRLEASGRDHLGHEGLVHSALTAIFTSAISRSDLGDLLRRFALLRADVGARDGLFIVEDAAAATRDPAGRVGVAFAMEDLGCVGEDLSGIEALYGIGVRCAGLAYNAGSALGGGLGQSNDPGLSRLGQDAVALMNALGMLVDLAHVGDETSVQAARASRSPVVISHAGARGIWDTVRMKPDDVLRACAGTGGVIGIEAAPGSTRVSGSTGHDLDAVMAHVEYCVELLGVDHVALGPDTFFGDHVGFYAAAGASPVPPPPGEARPRMTHVAGMENPAEAHRNAASWMVRHGWSDDECAKVLGGNVARIVTEVM